MLLVLIVAFFLFGLLITYLWIPFVCMLCLNFLYLDVCQNITPGMKLWGVVAEVNEKDLVVSLPGGLRGLVHASDAVDPIFDDKIEVCNKYFCKILIVLFLRSLQFTHIFTMK